MENWDDWENAYWEFKRELEPEFNYFTSTEEFKPKDKYALWEIVPTHYLQHNPHWMFFMELNDETATFYAQWKIHSGEAKNTILRVQATKCWWTTEGCQSFKKDCLNFIKWIESNEKVAAAMCFSETYTIDFSKVNKWYKNRIRWENKRVKLLYKAQLYKNKINLK